MAVEQHTEDHSLTLTVDLRPREFAAVIRFRVARTSTWRALLGPVGLFACAGFLLTEWHRGPLRLGRLAVEILIAGVAAEAVYLTLPYFVGARLARSGRGRTHLEFNSAGIQMDRGEDHTFLPWSGVEMVETAQFLHLAGEDTACSVPKRLLHGEDEVTLRRLAAQASARLPSAR